MDPARKIIRNRVAMLFDHPFFGHLALGLEPTPKKEMSMPTMATDGRRLFYDSEFVNQISDDELQGVIIHEIYHIVLWHIKRQQGRDSQKWNIACDFAVNDMVLKEFKLPRGCLYDPKFAGKSADFIYNQLPDPPTVGIPMVTLDSHEEWRDWGNGKGEDEDKESQNGQTQGAGDGQNGGENRQNGIELGDDVEQQWRERIAQAATQARMQGKLPAHLKSLIDEALQPKLDWKSILREKIVSAVKSDFRIIPPSKKHLWRGLYLPSTWGEEINIAVAVDSSGSISDSLLSEFIAEIRGICQTFQNYTVHGCIADTRIVQTFELNPYDSPPEIALPKEAKGRGGTSFVEPVKWAEDFQNISCLVYLTDLMGSFPEDIPPFPVVWVCSDENMTAPFGDIIYLPS